MQFWDFTRSPASVQLLLEAGAKRGLRARDLLQGSGLTLERLADAEISIDPAQEVAVIRNLLTLIPNEPGLGLLVGMRYHATAYGILGLGMLSAASGLDALLLAHRFLSLTFALAMLEHERSDGMHRLKFVASPALEPALREFAVQRAVGATCRLMLDVLGADTQLEALSLSMKRSPHMPYAIGSVRIEWGSQSNELRVTQATMAQALPQANAATYAMCVRMCEDLMTKRRTSLSTGTLLREMLAAQPDGSSANLQQVAGWLHVSERSLKRRLHDEGLSFRKLHEEVRRARADKLLIGSELSVAEIAARLGYSDVSAFSQAYKRWTGFSPTNATEQMRGQEISSSKH